MAFVIRSKHRWGRHVALAFTHTMDTQQKSSISWNYDDSDPVLGHPVCWIIVITPQRVKLRQVNGITNLLHVLGIYMAYYDTLFCFGICLQQDTPTCDATKT